MSQEDFVITWNPYLAQDLKLLRQGEVLVEQLYRILYAIMLLLRLVPCEEQSEDEQEKQIFQAGMKLQERFKEQKDELCSLLEAFFSGTDLDEHQFPDDPLFPDYLEDYASEVTAQARESLDPDKFLHYREALEDEISVEEYTRRSEAVSSLIVSRELPSRVLYHVNRVRKAYRLGLDEVTVVFCRALLEALLREQILARMGGSSESRGRPDGEVLERALGAKAWSFHGLVQKARDLGIVEQGEADLARKIGTEAGKVLHQELSSNEKTGNVLELVRGTLEVVESLYG